MNSFKRMNKGFYIYLKTPNKKSSEKWAYIYGYIIKMWVKYLKITM